jgi:hypothetical protein
MFGLVSLNTTAALGQSDGARRQAGLWQQTQTLVMLETPQASAAVSTAARATLGRAVVSERVCVTQAEVNRDTLASRIGMVALAGPDFRWTRLELSDAVLKATGAMGRGTIALEGKLTPILTDIVATSNIIDPVIGPARRVQRTVIARLGPC